MFRKQLERLETCLGMNKKVIESLWTWIEERTWKINILVGVCCKSPDQDQEADDVPCKQIELMVHRDKFSWVT